MSKHDPFASSASSEPHIYSIKELNSEARRMLEMRFGKIWLEAEIASFNLYRNSGHIYFSLKEQQGISDKLEVQAIMYATSANKLQFEPKVGDQVLVHANVTLYEPQGKFQLNVTAMQESGVGALRKKFEVLKRALSSEGLFDEHHKKPIPAMPNTIGVITSSQGAAIDDIKTTLYRRFPLINIEVLSVPVQGPKAAPAICDALTKANTMPLDVIILGRGGGSLEDLWAFNEESVARAVFASDIPIITGIGHDADISIADWVADLHASTPTAAAEHAVPDKRDVYNTLKHLHNRFELCINNALRERQAIVKTAHQTLLLSHPQRLLNTLSQRLDDTQKRSEQALKNSLAAAKHRFEAVNFRVQKSSPAARITLQYSALKAANLRLATALKRSFTHTQNRVRIAVTRLDAVSPLATLKRGYAIAKTSDNTVITSSTQAPSGCTINVTVNDGEFDATVN